MRVHPVHRAGYGGTVVSVGLDAVDDSSQHVLTQVILWLFQRRDSTGSRIRGRSRAFPRGQRRFHVGLADLPNPLNSPSSLLFLHLSGKRHEVKERCQGGFIGLMRWMLLMVCLSTVAFEMNYKKTSAAPSACFSVL